MAIQNDRFIDFYRAQVHSYLPRIFDLLPYRSVDQVQYVAQCLFEKINRQDRPDHRALKNIDHISIDPPGLKIDEKMCQDLNRVFSWLDAFLYLTDPSVNESADFKDLNHEIVQRALTWAHLIQHMDEGRLQRYVRYLGDRSKITIEKKEHLASPNNSTDFLQTMEFHLLEEIERIGLQEHRNGQFPVFEDRGILERLFHLDHHFYRRYRFAIDRSVPAKIEAIKSGQLKASDDRDGKTILPPCIIDEMKRSLFQCKSINPNLAICVLKADRDMIHFLEPCLLDNAEFIFEAAKSYPHALRLASSRLCDDANFLLKMAGHTKFVLNYASPRLRDHREFTLKILEATDGFADAFAHASARLCDDRKFMLAVMQKNESLFPYTRTSLLDDRIFMLKVVQKSGIKLYHASDRVRDDSEVVLAATKQCDLAFSFASDRLRDDRSFVLKIACISARAFFFASSRLRDDRVFLLQAIKLSPCTIYFTSDRLSSDPQLREKALI